MIEIMLSLDEQTWLAEQARKHLRIVEVGCWVGGSTCILAENTNGQVWAVDNFKGGGVDSDKLPKNGLFFEFVSNTSQFPNITIYNMDSVQAAQSLIFKSFDMIFLDASHDYENVKTDIESWLPLLETGGLLCGHDSASPDVHKAVEDILGVDSGLTGIWSYIKP